MKYRQITFQENQETAQKLLRHCGFDSPRDLPLDPELVLRRMDVKVVPSPGLRQNHGIQGGVAKLGARFGDLAYNIAASMTDDLGVSPRILEITLQRHSVEQPITTIIRTYPELMRSRLNE